MKHKHRIIPGHMGGKYESGNVIEVEVTRCEGNRANHVMWHFANWQLWGKAEDKLAWKGLAGFLNKEEIFLERMRVNGRNLGLRNKGRKLSEERKKALLKNRLGKKHSQETRDKMSKIRLGKPQPSKRKPRTVEVKKKISETMKGERKSLSHRQNLSEANKGIHVGKSWWVNEENEVKFSHEYPGPGWMKGRKWKG